MSVTKMFSSLDSIGIVTMGTDIGPVCPMCDCTIYLYHVEGFVAQWRATACIGGGYSVDESTLRYEVRSKCMGCHAKFGFEMPKGTRDADILAPAVRAEHVRTFKARK